MPKTTPFIGILMLDTRFQRYPGDVGHPTTWPFPVRFRVVQGASAGEATGEDPSRLLELFIAAGEELVGVIAESGRERTLRVFGRGLDAQRAIVIGRQSGVVPQIVASEADVLPAQWGDMAKMVVGDYLAA